MNQKIRSTIKLVAILIVALMVAMELNIIIIPAIAVYKFWLMVISFSMLLIGSK